ncbi:polyprenyl synthetase family protein [Cellulosilyticum sp. I15G10I2]|uniref:polyprenyl synthetase family protein n=1 Tax=Cellulosilyticum sp. I15G10I2 TaxID=1892843 RepID=UPI00085BC26D|nr:polyprenyl synthetase family protein [Cellulosilyticum sp. I15G10I2]
MINKSLRTNDNINFITFDDATILVKEQIDTVLGTSPSVIRKYMEHLKASRGKYIRAVSLLACAENEEGLIHPNAVKLAAAIEILHLATLVHDDVIDNADLRRGVVTLQKKYGKKTAVICGDYLLCVALKLASSVTNREDYLDLDLPDYMGKVCLGELNQHSNNGNLDLSIYEYFKIIAGKTAALFEASFYAGAIVCESDSQNTKKYKLLGRYIGMIFQLTDDCIDFETSKSIAKKPVQSDFEQGVITLPLIHAFMQKLDFKEKARQGQVARDDINDIVAHTGGLIFTRKVSKKYYDKSIKIINELNITEEKRIKLIAILDKASHVL